MKKASWLFSKSIATALLLLCAVPSSAVISLTPRTELPFLTHGDPFSVSVAVLDDGSFAIAGTEVLLPDDHTEIPQFVVQFYASNGMRRGDPLIFHGPASGGVGSLGEHYFIYWATAFHNPVLINKAAFYNRDGGRLGDPFRWLSYTIVGINDYHDFQYSPGPAWRILPVEYHQVGTYPNTSPYFEPTLQIFSSDARPLGLPFPIASSKRYVEFHNVAINGRGRVVVASTQCSKKHLVIESCVNGVQMFDGPGRARSPLLTEGIAQPLTVEGNYAGGFRVGLSDQGAFLMTWLEGPFGAGALLARLYGRNGEPLQETLTVASTDQGSPYPNAVVALPKGNFLVSWSINQSETSSFRAFLSEYSGTTRSLQPPTQYLENEQLIAEPILGVNAAGQGVLVWKSMVGESPTGYWSRFTVTSAQNDQTGETHEP